jgi:hypothetical protein
MYFGAYRLLQLVRNGANPLHHIEWPEVLRTELAFTPDVQ